jgi:hypothetical protein
MEGVSIIAAIFGVIIIGFGLWIIHKISNI